MHSNDDIVIYTRNLSKVYKLYKNPKDRLKEALHPRRKKYHKEFYALKNINIEIKRGEVIGIVGKNGSGKSTLLKILSRVLTPSSGEFNVHGKISSLLELGSGFNPELTGLENVYFYGTILGFSEEKIKGKLQEILDFAEIGDYIYQPLKTYSSGMRARLAFSVAINVDPDILILDEVLAVGDELFRRKCYARMEQFFKGQKTVLFVSHSVSDVNQLCSRVMLVDEGECLLEGNPKLVTTLYQQYLFSKPENTRLLKNSIIELNSNKERKQLADRNIQLFDVNNNDINKIIPVEYDKTNILTESYASEVQKPYFLEDFIPKSRVEYKNSNVEITDIKITTVKGSEVNVLVVGERYVFSYNAKFYLAAENVIFGMQIKNEKGLLLGGITSDDYLSHKMNFLENDSINFKCFFTCNLLHGNYYCNAGVAMIQNERMVYLNRIVDAIVFKVQPLKNSKSGFMFFDLKLAIVRN